MTAIPASIIRACTRVLRDIPQDHGICLCRDEACAKHRGRPCGRLFLLDDPSSRVNRCCAGAPCAGGWKRVEVAERVSA